MRWVSFLYHKWIWTNLIIFCVCMMTSSNGNIFRVTGHLCGEFTGPRWIPRTKASDAVLWCFLWSASEKTVEKTVVRLVIWDAIVPIMTSLWWNCIWNSWYQTEIKGKTCDCVRLNKRLRKQTWGWWFETLSRPLWRHRNMNTNILSSGTSFANRNQGAFQKHS